MRLYLVSGLKSRTRAVIRPGFCFRVKPEFYKRGVTNDLLLRSCQADGEG